MKDEKKLRDILNAIESYSVSDYNEFVEDTKTRAAIL